MSPTPPLPASAGTVLGARATRLASCAVAVLLAQRYQLAPP